MIWKRGWILSSLRYHVEKEIRTTLYKNKDYINNRWSKVESLIMWSSKNIFKAVILLSALAGIFTFILGFYSKTLKAIFPQIINGFQSTLNVQSDIFNAQITIAALIFPLVLGFVGFLLQSQTSNETMWMVYRNHSGFMLAGFSALFLTFFMLVTTLARPWLTHSFLVSASITSIVWFAVNLILSGYFLWRTLQFLSMNERMSVVMRYAINEVVPRDIKIKLLGNLSSRASEYGLVSGGKEGLFSVTSYSIKKLNVLLTKESLIPKAIDNLWFRILNIGIWIWGIELRCFKKTNDIAILHLDITALRPEVSKADVARTNEIPMNTLSQSLIRFSIRRKRFNRNSHLDIEHMVSALFSQLEQAIKAHNLNDFGIAVRNLEYFYSALESSTNFPTQQGMDNWLLLRDGGWLGKSTANAFLSDAYRMSELVVTKIPEESGYFRTWNSFFQKLFYRQSDGSADQAKSYLEGNFLIWCVLMSWIEEHKIIGNQFRRPVENAIVHYIGHWEHWSFFLTRGAELNKDKEYDLALIHLEKTAFLSIYANRHKNIEALHMATDTLINWFNLFDKRHAYVRPYWPHEELINVFTLDNDEECSLMNAPTASVLHGSSSIHTIAMRNKWEDTRIIVAAFLLLERIGGKYVNRDIVNALLLCKPLKPDSGVSTRNNTRLSATSMVEAFLRQCDCWDERSLYSNNLEKQLESFDRVGASNSVSHRIVFTAGTAADRYLPVFFRVIGCGNSQSIFKLTRRLSEFLSTDYVSQRVLEKVIVKLKTLVNIDKFELGIVCDHFEIDQMEAERRHGIFVQSINDIVLGLENSATVNVASAELDDSILLKFGEESSKYTFTLVDGPIPISLFKDIDFVDSKSTLYQIDISKFEKKYVAEGIDVDRVGNENEWLNNVVRDHAALIVSDQLNRQMKWIESSYNSLSSLITAALDEAKDIREKGGIPILLIASSDVEQCVDESIWGYGVESDWLTNDINVRSEMPTEYLYDIDGVECFRSPLEQLNSCFVLTADSLSKINVSWFEDGRCVDVNFHTAHKDDTEGTLNFAYGIELELLDQPCFKFMLD